MADAGRQFGERRQGIGVRGEIERPELAQLGEQEERILTLQELGIRPEADGERMLPTCFGSRGIGVVEPHRHERNVEIIGRRSIVAFALLMADKRLQRGADLVAVAGRRRLVGARHRDQVGQNVARREQHIENLGRCRQGAVPNRIEHGLEHMREPDQIFEAEHARSALDGVDAAEHRVHGVLLLGAVPHVSQAGVDRFEPSFGLLEERLLPVHPNSP